MEEADTIAEPFPLLGVVESDIEGTGPVLAVFFDDVTPTASRDGDSEVGVSQA